jgi:hypothetical protein
VTLAQLERTAAALESRAAKLEAVESALTPEQEIFLLGETRAELVAKSRRAAMGCRLASCALRREGRS